MIRYIQGRLLRAADSYIVVLAGGIGYEILLPEIVWQAFQHKKPGEDDAELFISFHQTAQQPKPLLIGFLHEIELEFFEQLIKAKDIGPVTASKALTLPVPIIARAIENRDVQTIMQLKGIGRRKADMIISELNGKVGKYALMKETERESAAITDDFRKQVLEVLVKQLGHNRAEAVRMVDEALQRNQNITTPEELFEEVYRGTKQQETKS
ncbi:MAG: Holliday junction branch migration protein RuvA [Pseudomonadota bacterium]